jgi:DNA-directed RNA polymerase specialized sigma24 family protein
LGCPLATDEKVLWINPEYQGLKKVEDASIVYLRNQMYPKIVQLCKQAKIPYPEQVAAEIVNDSIWKLLQKIDNQQFVFQGISPAGMCFEIGKGLVSNAAHSKPTQESRVTDGFEPYHEPNPTPSSNETTLIEQLLQQFGEPCAQLIRLKYMEAYKYKEIIALKLTHFTSEAALTNKTTDCYNHFKKFALEKGFKKESLS